MSGSNARMNFMKEKLKFRKKFTIQNFLEWDHEIFEQTMKFYEKFRIYPNILLANSETYHQIDLTANFITRKYIRDETHSANYKNPPYGSFVQLSGFSSQDFELDFALDENLKLGKVQLIFEQDPDWGGEEVWDDLNDDWDIVNHTMKVS